MKEFLKRYKELIIMLFPMCFLAMDWYKSFRLLDEDWSVQLPYKGYEFLFFSWGPFFIIFLLCVMIQVISIKYKELSICAVIGHISYLYSLFIFPMVFIRTFIQNFYSFYMAGAYIAFVCEILVIILNVINIFKKEK